MSTEAKQSKRTSNNARRKDQRYTRTMNVYIIETNSETDAAVQRMRHETCVGFDCEGIGGLSRFDKISLIQISTEHTIYLFDICEMGFRIPRSLRIWLSSAKCMKFIHDSRQDQDALYHQYDITLQGVFDTTVADLVHRTWVGKSKDLVRLNGMNAVAKNSIRSVRDYMVNFMVEDDKIAPSISAKELRQRSRRNKSRICTSQLQLQSQRKKLTVNIFDGKRETKVLMDTDRKLWARRPLPENLVVYAAADGYMSLLLGQYYRCKFKEWMMAKTLLVSAKWCTLVARHTDGKSSSGKVMVSIRELIKADTSDMSIADLPAIDEQIAAAAVHATRGRSVRQAGVRRHAKTTEKTKTKAKTNGVEHTYWRPKQL
eukprot:CAMPEP_0202685180 /NCGR_PEP_ID=MMETSP1385-20130828/892_1 /ASSEMBLY_ACC=CAM_ASM_000861 /TAXON_ID=933848 /ORGANISM="Elphidium margaritaceum" /LENGTH=371 /DNA_ID=CAMNT_0049339461 /DNA_START=114 /DNA_END=1229 /DNA_ORIENTATION=-